MYKILNHIKTLIIYISVVHFLAVSMHLCYIGAMEWFSIEPTSSLFSARTYKQQNNLVNTTWQRPDLNLNQSKTKYINLTAEQFTVIIMTYKRIAVLNRTLAHLNGLQSINKTIIVWNDVDNKPPDFNAWNNLSYPIQVFAPKHNSLNNRFFIYEDVQTEAILSLDDDIILDHDIINFSFRVWQSDRQALVGNVGRTHKWDKKSKTWKYDFRNNCNISMALLGAAFYHKQYNHAYREEMPKAILRKVDSLFNCEDIAMNFLISHITKRPPLLVGDEINSFCRECQSNLSFKKNHYINRNDCLNYFADIYGYMPLLYSFLGISNLQIKNSCSLKEIPCEK